MNDTTSHTTNTSDARRGAMMRGVNWYDPVDLTRHLLAAADYKIARNATGEVESISISFDGLITGTGPWSQALRGLEALGFKGVQEVARLHEPAGRENYTFTFDHDVFLFGDGPSMRMREHVRPPSQFTIKGDHNIALAQQLLSAEHQVEALAQRATGQTGR